MSTIIDVARLADVSTATVSRVINSPELVKSETRERVLKAMEMCHYQYNALARGFVTKRSYIIGLIVPSITNAIFAESTRGVQDTAAKHGYQVILGNTDYRSDKEQGLIKSFRELQVDGLIITTTNPGNQPLLDMTGEGFPYVLVYSTVRKGRLSSVGVDNVYGGDLAVSYLIGLGHRRIGMIAGLFTISDKSKHRWLGYRKSLKKHDLPYDPQLVKQLPYKLQSGKEGIKMLMEQPAPPTAVFCSNDYMAMGAMEGARELGLNLPRDLSIIGFDDNPLSSYLKPSLTTIHQPAYEMGVLAVREVLERIAAPEREPVRRLLDIELIERESTAGPPAG